MPTHYEALGVERGATTAEIKRAFHRRARLYHPDAHAGSIEAVRENAERTMQTLNVAWQVLQDPVRRRRYDRLLERAARVEASSRPSNGRDSRSRPRQLTLGGGFRAWLGGAGMPAETTGDGRRVYNLSVADTADLSALAALAPDRLVGLHCEGAPITDDQLRQLTPMRSLRVLDLTGTKVTDVGLLHLVGCEGLETLLLWDTAITDAGLDLIGRMPRLRQLGLGNTAVTDAGLARLGSLRALRLLQLAGTNVEGPGLAHLHGLRDLERVSLPWRVRGRHRRLLKAALPASAAVL